MGNFSYSADNGSMKMDLSASHYESYNISQDGMDTLDRHEIIFTVVSAFICVVGIIGNSLVLVVTRNRLRGLHKTMSVFILNLSVADLLFLVFCVPTSVISLTVDHWSLGTAICKLMDFSIYATMLASIYTLVAMSLDRFSAVVYPLKLIQLRSISNAKIIVIVIWLIASAISSPFLVVNLVYDPYGNGHLQNQTLVCGPIWPSFDSRTAYYTFLFLVGYVIPLLLVTCAYVLILRALWRTLHIMRGSRESSMGRSKRKVTIMVSVVVLVFGLCWFPEHFIFIWQSYGEFPFVEATLRLKEASLCLAYLNSCLNPLIYSIMSENFRKAMKKALQKCGTADSPNTPGSAPGKGAPIIRLTPVTQNNHYHYQQNGNPDSQKRYYPRRNLHRHRQSDANRFQTASGKPFTW